MTEETVIPKFKIEITALSDSSSDEEQPDNEANITEIIQKNTPDSTDKTIEPIIEERLDKRGRRITQRRLQAVRDTGHKNKQRLLEIRRKADLFDKIQHLLPKEIDYDKIASNISHNLSCMLNIQPQPQPKPQTVQPQPKPQTVQPQPQPAFLSPQNMQIKTLLPNKRGFIF